jgi:PHS family inorganic phosphate transporter-like MFS transporter
MLIIFATIMCLTTPTGAFRASFKHACLIFRRIFEPDNCLIYLTMFRIVLGVGVGGGLLMLFILNLF